MKIKDFFEVTKIYGDTILYINSTSIPYAYRKEIIKLLENKDILEVILEHDYEYVYLKIQLKTNDNIEKINNEAIIKYKTKQLKDTILSLEKELEELQNELHNKTH